MGINSLNFNNAYNSSDRRKISVPIEDDRRTADRRLISRDSNSIFPNINYTDEVPRNAEVRAFLPQKLTNEEYKIPPDTENIFARASNLPVNITNSSPPVRQFVLTPRPNFTGESENSKISVNATVPADNVVMCAVGTISPLRRVLSLKSKLDKRDYVPAAGLVGLAVMNGPEDWRDIKSAYFQVREYIMRDGKYKPKYDYGRYQHDFSFLRGTAIEKWMHKQAEAGHGWANWLLDNDKTLADTNFGENILNKLKIKDNGSIPTGINDFNGNSVMASSYKGPLFKEITGKAMRRTTKLGLIAMGLIELPKIIKAMTKGDTIKDKAKNTSKQTIKSAINVTFITAAMGIFGAIGSKYFKGLGSLMGMSVGAVIGGKLSDKVQEFIH